MKKVLRIKAGEFLSEAFDNRINTTANINSAMDISGWSFEKLEYIMSNLRKVGFTKVEVVEVKFNVQVY